MAPLSPIAFGVGNPADWMIIMIVALIVFGPKKLPELGKQLGQAMREFRKISDEFTGAAHSVRDEVESAWQAPQTSSYHETHAVSSPTVEAATTHHVYDQAPEDLMAPVVAEVPHSETQDGKLLTPPPAQHALDEANTKGH